MTSILANLAIGASMHWNDFKLRRPLLQQASNVEAAQLNLLLSILEKNKNTGFGRQHGFSSIRTFAEYREHVRVHNYEDLRPYIDRQKRGEQAVPNNQVVAEV